MRESFKATTQAVADFEIKRTAALGSQDPDLQSQPGDKRFMWIDAAYHVATSGKYYLQNFFLCMESKVYLPALTILKS